MKRLLLILFLLAALAGAYTRAQAQTTQSNVNGTTININGEDKDTQHLLRAMDLFTGGNFLRKTANDVANFISNTCYYALIYVYRLIGTILIPIPDFTNPSSLTGDAVAVIHDVYSIMAYLGFFLAILCFVFYVAVSASGLSSGNTLNVMAFMRLAVALALLFAWPSIFSVLTRATTEIGYLIYSQNRISTAGVFEGIKSLDSLNKQPQEQNNNASSGGASPDNVRLYARSIWNVVYTVSIFLCLIGLFIAGRKISAGDQGAYKILLGALIGLAIVISAGHFVRYLIPSMTSLEGNTSVVSASQTLNTGGSPSLPTAKPDPYNPASSETSTVVDDMAAMGGAILRMIISLWGLIICVGVLLAKFFQVASLLVLFLLGPVLAGLVASPRTEQIARSGLNMTLNLMLNSIIWAIALLGLYLITHIQFSAENLGVNNLMTAFAILAGLKLIQNSDKFASLFAQGSHIGHHGDWGAFMGSAAAMGSSATRSVQGMGESKKVITQALASKKTHKAIGAGIGAAAGFLIPGVGNAIGAKAGAMAAQAGGAFYNHVANNISGPSNNVLSNYGKKQPDSSAGKPNSSSGTKAASLSSGRPKSPNTSPRK